MTMPKRVRLVAIFLIIVLSSVYALLVKAAPDTAPAVAIGYIAVVVTLLFVELLGKHYDR